MAEVNKPSSSVSPPTPAPNTASTSTPASPPNGVARTAAAAAAAGKNAEEERNRTSGIGSEPATTTPRPSADANSPGAAAALQQKKRKYEEATEEEKNALNSYHLSNPQLKQRELAEWFKNQYGKSINQSTVSRNLKKFKASPPPPNKPRGTRLAQPSPTKRDRKAAGASPMHHPQQQQQQHQQQHQHPQHQHQTQPQQAQQLLQQQLPQQKKIQTSKQLPPSAVALPPTPPPRDNRTASLIDPALWDFYEAYQRRYPDAAEADVDRALKVEAQRLVAGALQPPQPPPPPPEKKKLLVVDDPTAIDDAWVASWKQIHNITSPAAASSASSLASSSASSASSSSASSSSASSSSAATEPSGSPNGVAAGGGGRGGGGGAAAEADVDRTCSEETEPRSPVSTVSSIERRPSLELKAAGNHNDAAVPQQHQHQHQQHLASNHPTNRLLLEAEPRRKEIEALRRDIEKRDRRIVHEQKKRTTAQRKLDKLLAARAGVAGGVE